MRHGSEKRGLAPGCIWLKLPENVAARCLSPFLADHHQLGWPVGKVGQAPKAATTSFTNGKLDALLLEPVPFSRLTFTCMRKSQ